MTKTKLIFAATLAFFVSCANDDTANKQSEQEPGAEGLTSFVEDAPTTRTTGEYDGSGLNFFWTEGDRLWVNAGTATSPVLKQDSKNNISNLLVANPAIPTGVKRAAKASFAFAGTYTASSYPVRYTGKGNVNGGKVTIKVFQNQPIPNDASHIGEDGDFGVATATKPIGDNKYHFTLDHKAAYITFMPYTTQSWGPNAVIQRIRVYTSNTSDALAGTFDLADDGTLSNPTSTSNRIELAISNFPIPSTETYATNGATMVVNPGTYSNVSIEYLLYDPVTQNYGNITKTYSSVTFTAGKNKKVHTNLQVTEYPGNNYYMWDAQQNYWAGYEWDGANPTQPTIVNHTNATDAPQSTYNSSAHTPRDFNDVQGYTDASGASPAVLPNTMHFKALPNVNELCWYVQDGDLYFDFNTLWATMNHLYAGGVWLKKKGNISGYSSTAAPDGIDYTRSTNTPTYSTTLTPGKPGNPSDYFYLPALGRYNRGNFASVGSYGLYWSSTPAPWTYYYPQRAYRLNFDYSQISVEFTFRYNAQPLWTAQ